MTTTQPQFQTPTGASSVVLGSECRGVEGDERRIHSFN